MTRFVGWLGLVVLALVCMIGPASAGPPPIDPRQMSGIPRVDPQLTPGTITVRVLDGGFDKPATNSDVTLEITGTDGTKETRTAKTDASGRATFDGLASFIGGNAIAKATVGSESLASQSIALSTEAGSRVMLVAGGGGGAAAAPRHGQAGGPEVPLPGTAFPLEGTKAGELVVGTFDLDARKPMPDVEVTLEIAKPDGTKETKTATSDARGKVEFKGLGEPKGAKLTVSAVVVEGQPAQRSSTFEMDATVGMAVVLAKGTFDAGAQPQPQQRPQQRPQLPPPRVDPRLPTGTVHVTVVDGGDVPVSGHPIAVVKKDATGVDVDYPGSTGADGTADIEVEIQSDAIYLVETIYDGGPYQSGFFQTDRKGGVAVDLRVWATTSDVSRVRSVVQFDIDGLENDLARVVQLQDVMVMGDEAFWPQGGMRIMPAEGGKGLKVLPMSEDLLAHDDEKAPYVTLAGPIPPGELVRLGLAYVIDHDGNAKIQFSTQLDSLETSVLVGDGQTLDATGAKATDHASPIEGKTVYVMGPRAPGQVLEFAVEGLPIRDPTYRVVGGIIATLLVGLTMAMVALRRRTDARSRLVTRRDELLGVLEQTAGSDPAKRSRVITALDRIYRQIDALPETAGAAESAGDRWITIILVVLTELQLVAGTTVVLLLGWQLVGFGGALIVYLIGLCFFALALLSRRRPQAAIAIAAAVYVLAVVLDLSQSPDPLRGWPVKVIVAAMLVSGAVRGWARRRSP
ncbi:MAG TPA: hypothetical protein VG755_43005 [Nannocystaceae bacterium]|nr:hypothetical protein [Nannocystaceae bacterium]